MTKETHPMFEHPIRLVMQQAPEDGFDPAGPQQFQVVAYCSKTIKGSMPLTDVHDSAEGALGQLGDYVTLARFEQATSQLGHHDRLFGALGESIARQDREINGLFERSELLRGRLSRIMAALGKKAPMVVGQHSSGVDWAPRDTLSGRPVYGCTPDE